MKINTKKTEELVQKKWKNGCPMCGGREWTLVGDEVFTPILIGNGKSLQIGGKMVPMVPIVCSNCGFTVSVNGIVAGILEDEENGNDTSK